MSHPIPGHEYNEGHRGPSKPKLTALQRAMGKSLKDAGKTMKRKGEGDFAHLKRILEMKKGNRTPKYGRYGEERFKMIGQSPNLPPGYKQSDLD